MAKILVVTKPDKTVHRMPTANKTAILAYNNRVKQSDKWHIEEMDEKEANALSYVNKNYVADPTAAAKIKAKDAELADKDARLKELEAQLAALEAANSAAKKDEPNSDKVSKNAKS